MRFGELAERRRQSRRDLGRRDQRRALDVVADVREVLGRRDRIAHREHAAGGEDAEDAPGKRRRVGQHEVDALLGPQAAGDEELRECARAIRDLRVRPRAIAEAQRDALAPALADPIEQEVVGEIEVVGERWGHDVSRAACARPMIMRWISLVPS